jgi:hypothetical protein
MSRRRKKDALEMGPYTIAGIGLVSMLLIKHARQQSKLRKSCEAQVKELQAEIRGLKGG